MNEHDIPRIEKSSLPVGLVGILIVQLAVGYEWFLSGLTKMVRSGFPAGLAADLKDNAAAAAPWYRWFLNHVVIPNGPAFGYLIEITEVLAGAALLAAALVWLFGWRRIPLRGKYTALSAIVVASLAAIFMAVNFHLSKGSTHPWIIPRDGFDESLDLDSLLPLIHGVLIGVCVSTWFALRAGARAAAGHTSSARRTEEADIAA
jgi:hypothetical protein